MELAFWLAVAQTGAALVAPWPASTGVVNVVLFVVVNGIMLWIMWLARGGANWARILRTVGVPLVLVVFVLTGLGVRTPFESVADVIFSTLQLALDVVVVVLLWRPASNAYFRAVAAEKRQFREWMLR